MTKPCARDRARAAGKLLRKLLKGKTIDQRQRYARGYFLVVSDQDPAIKEHRDAFLEEAGLQ